MLDSLSYSFLQHALIAAILASIACGIIGALIVVNRLVFISGGIAHMAYGGLGLAFVTNLPMLPVTLTFTLFTSGILGGMTYKNKARTDAVIGALWAGGMAMGILLLNLKPGYSVNLMSYLFGNILLVSSSDLITMSILILLIMMIICLFYQDFLALSFEEDYAKTRGISVNALYFLLLCMVAVTIVMLISIVGLILVMGLLTIPAYLAEMHSTSLKSMMFKACLWSLFFSIGGLFISYQLDLNSGSTIVMLAVIGFFGMKGISAWKAHTSSSRHSRHCEHSEAA